MKNKRLSDIIEKIDDRYIAEAAPAEKKTRNRAVWVRWCTAAACLVLLVSVCVVSLAVAAEAKEYKTAVRFFNDYGMSTDGLTREEIKAVYRDITTKSFTYSKTAEVIQNSISPDKTGGYEIPQENPSPEDIENLWNYKNYTGGFIGDVQNGIHYEYRSEYRTDENEVEIHDRSYIEKYNGETLIWSVSVSEFAITGFSPVSDGVIAFGRSDDLYASQDARAWIAKIDSDGDLLWKHGLKNGFEREYIAEVLENSDGSYAVISRGDLQWFCLSRITGNGKKIGSSKTEIGNRGILNAARFGEGYIVQLGSYLDHDRAKIVKVDPEGNITEEFSYSGDDSYYYITDMIEFNGNIYLSAYAVPKLEDEDQSAGGRYEIANILNYLFDNGIYEIPSEELTPMVRDNYTAVLLVCDPNSGVPQEFYSVKGSLGGTLSVSDTGMLQWKTESITTTFFSVATSSFTIGGTSYVFRYTFDKSGALISQEKTGEITDYRR